MNEYSTYLAQVGDPHNNNNNSNFGYETCINNCKNYFKTYFISVL